MPAIEAAVGGLTLPLPAGVANTALSDPPVVALLDYLGYWLRDMLNAKLANMGGPTDITQQVYNNACPAANLFPYDPQQFWVRNPSPALYIWWSGKSTRKPLTMVFDKRERELSLMWVYSEIHAPDGDDMRAGLPAAVDAVFQLAYSNGRHPSYGYNGAAAGTPIFRSMGVESWEYMEGTPGTLVPVPSSDARAGGVGDGQIIRYHPAVMGKILVSDKIHRNTATTALTDLTLAISTSEIGDPLDQAELISMVVPAPPEVP